MRITLLLPTLNRLAGVETLARWLARGDRAADASPGRDAQLRAHFEFFGPTLPVAALTRSVDADDADSALWLRCDPAHVMADAVTLRLLACGEMQLSAEDVEELARVLKPLFGDAGFPLEATRPDRWYLRCPREARVPKFSDPVDALGDDLARHLPEGDNARQWRSLLNDAQIMLTQHPLNAQRARRGLPPVNSVWFWGAGLLPEWVRCKFDAMHTHDEIAAVLARLAQTPIVELRGSRNLASPLSDAAGCARENPALLIDLAGQRDIDLPANDWLASIDAQLAKRQLAEVHLHFLGGERVTIKPAHRWRFWRRVKPVA